MKRTSFKRSFKGPRKSKNLFDCIPKEKKDLFNHLTTPSKEEEWTAIREELKTRFTNVGIISCEVKLEGCIKSHNFGFGWTFAHSLKRDKIPSEKDDPETRKILMRFVIYACVSCHSMLESRGNKKLPDGSPTMKEIIEIIIAKRDKQP